MSERIIGISITLPESMVLAIDKERGDIPRSKYIYNVLKRVKLGKGVQID